MNENIDLTMILYGCPEGTKLYSPIFGEVSFVKIKKGCLPKIVVNVEGWGEEWFSREGYYYCGSDDVEMVLFPSKEQRDWAKFEHFWDTPKVERFDPKTLKPFDKVLIRDEDCYWTADLFSHIDDSIGRVCCSWCSWKQCIPYNDETKHLVGTSDDCPEYYKWWEE